MAGLICSANSYLTLARTQSKGRRRGPRRQICPEVISAARDLILASVLSMKGLGVRNLVSFALAGGEAIEGWIGGLEDLAFGDFEREDREASWPAAKLGDAYEELLDAAIERAVVELGDAGGFFFVEDFDLLLGPVHGDGERGEDAGGVAGGADGEAEAPLAGGGGAEAGAGGVSLGGGNCTMA